jgi:hypothetical protein
MSFDELIQACLVHAAERQGVELGVAATGSPVALASR